MLVLGQILIWLLALAGIAGFSVAAIYYTGRALARARTPPVRRRAALLAAGSILGLFASAGAGFFGLAGLLYLAVQ